MLTVLVHRRILFVPSSCWSACSAFLLYPVAGPGLLSRFRHRPVQAAPARQDRHPHRRDGAHLRPGGTVHPPADSARSAAQHPRQHRAALQQHQHDLQQLGADRLGRRRHPGFPHERAPPHRGVRARSARQPAARVSGHQFYFLPADIVSQILNFGLPAPIDIQIDRQERGSQPRTRRPHPGPDAPHPRHRRPAHPADLRPAEAAHLHRPHQGRRKRLHAEPTSRRAC